MISGLVLNHLKGLGFVMNERYRPAAAGSRQVMLTEPLNETMFRNLAHARVVIAAWAADYNTESPH
jgi:hypothetical protein